jgi:hypothetical protein
MSVHSYLLFRGTGRFISRVRLTKETYLTLIDCFVRSNVTSRSVMSLEGRGFPLRSTSSQSFTSSSDSFEEDSECSRMNLFKASSCSFADIWVTSAFFFRGDTLFGCDSTSSLGGVGVAIRDGGSVNVEEEDRELPSGEAGFEMVAELFKSAENRV